MAGNLAEVLRLADSLRLSSQERETLHRHAIRLSQHGESLTQQIWNWLAENPQSAKYLKNLPATDIHRIKAQITEHFTTLCLTDYDANQADNQISLGAWPHKSAMSEQWISSVYDAFNQFLTKVIAAFPESDRELLLGAMHKRLQLDQRCAEIGYRQEKKESLQRQEALYEAIRFSNQLLAHYTSAPLLLDGIVETLSHYLKAPLLGIGFINPRTHQVRIRAAAGPAKAYFNNVKLSASATDPAGCGPGGRALRSNKVIQVDNFADDPTFDLWRSQAERFGLAGSITAPFKTRRGQQGLLSMYRSAEIPFPEGAAKLLNQLASDIGSALNRIHSQRELRRLHAYEDALDAINQMLLKNPTPPAIYRLLVDTIVEHTDAPVAYVRLIDPRTQIAEIVSHSGKGVEHLLQSQKSINLEGSWGLGITGNVFRSGQKFVVPNALSHPDFAVWKDLLNSLKLRGAAGFPIGEKDKKPEAVLFVGSRQSSYFSRPIVKLLDQLAGSASLALSSHRQRERLEFLSIHDSLTGLPNRAYFEHAITESMGRADRYHRQMAIGILDIDGFKEMNDTLGHAAGDDLLRAISRRLRTAMRKGDVVARVGGDEFGLILSMEDGVNIGIAAERLLQVLAEPVNWNDQNINVNARMGFTIYPIDNADRETLLRHADAVLYSAKEGNARFEVFQSAIAEKVEQRFRIRQTFPTALKEGNIRFFLQPQANMRLGKLDGAEMLARWREGDKWLSPAAFMPVIEHDPALIRLLDCQVIGEAVNLRRRLLARGLDLRISVNIGSRHLLHPSFLADLDAALSGCPDPSFLTLEITEVTALTDLPLAVQRLEAINLRHVSTSLDDFGTGHASLLYAASLPVKELKLGQEFMGGLLAKNAHASVTISALQFAELSGTRLIAEGVETSEQLAYWLRLGGQNIQGYFLAKPMEEDQFISWAKTLKLPPQPSPPRYANDDLLLLTRHVSVNERLHRLREMRAAGIPDPLPMDVPPLESCPTGHWIERRRPVYGHLPAFVAMDKAHLHRHDILAPANHDGSIELLEEWGNVIHSLILGIDQELIRNQQPANKQNNREGFYI